MRKVVQLLILGLFFLLSTGCVSESLTAIIPAKINDEVSKSTLPTKSNLDSEVEVLDKKIETKIGEISNKLSRDEAYKFKSIKHPKKNDEVYTDGNPKGCDEVRIDGDDIK